uniref:BTB domain-containing protein n=1 Tax=Coccidioides posadasii RMSCC 3488 TaxID=454284 RepID=A0A0J6FHB0_COCPO|nr:hypothetical protein CPAG_05064 [Coccidioides posadasii RMSCC 3488]
MSSRYPQRDRDQPALGKLDDTISSDDDGKPLIRRRRSRRKQLTTGTQSLARERHLNRHPFRSVIGVRIGSAPEEFLIHPHFLIKESKWFNTRLQSPSTKTLELADVQPDLFCTFVDWLYRDCLPSQENEADPTQYQQLIELYTDRLLQGRN